MEVTRNALKVIAVLLTSLAVVIGLPVWLSQSSQAANATGYYGSWSASGSPGSGAFSTQSVGFPGATVSSTGGLGSASGGTSWLPAWTGIGMEYGSSQNSPYLTVSVPSVGATTTVTFSNATPASGWSFALGDVDAESVVVSARDASGGAVPVQGWFNSTFNYCQNSPRASGCGGAQTDKPIWNGTSKLTGSGTDTAGASAWFTPTRSIKSLTFTSSKITGFPEYQLWIASDKSVPTKRSPVTIEATEPYGTPPEMKVDIGGTTNKASAVVYLYRASSEGGSAKLVAVTKSGKKSKKWNVKKVSIGKGTRAYFCARVGSKFSNTIRVQGKKKSGKALSAAGPIPRGDMVTCPK